MTFPKTQKWLKLRGVGLRAGQHCAEFAGINFVFAGLSLLLKGMQNKNMRGDEYFEQKNRISQRKGILRETILTCLTWVGLMK